jgi:Bcr/CflA subfamily drug resistance transporter
MKRENVLFIILVLISSLGHVSTDLYLPSLPAIAENLNTSFHAVKLTISMYIVGFAIAPLLYGPISDGVGRRKPLIIGLSLCLIGSIICFSAQSIEFLIFGRLFQGIGAGAGTSLFRSVLRDLFSGDKLAQYGSYSALITVGALASAPILGGYIQHYLGWRSNFIFLFFVTFIALLSVLYIVPETNQYLHSEHLTIKKLKLNFITLITSPIFVSYSLINFLTYGAILAWVTSGPILLQHVVGLNPVVFGWVYAVPGVAFALGAIINSQYVMRFGAQRMLQFSMICMLIAGLLMLGLRVAGYINVIVIVGPAMLLLFSVPITFNNSFAGAFHPFPHIAGMAGALFGTLTTLGGVASSSLLAFSPDIDQIPMALVIIGCAFLSCCIYYFGIKRKPS